MGAVALAFCGVAAYPVSGQQRPISPDRPIEASVEAMYTLLLPVEASQRLPGHAHAVAFDRQNRLYVLDRASSTVWIFGERGALEQRLHLGDAARSVFQMTVTVDGRMIVSDTRRRAFVTVDANQPHRATVHPFGLFALTGPLMAHPSGGVITRVRPLPDSAGSYWDRKRMLVKWFPLDGRPPGTLLTLTHSLGAPVLYSAPLVAPLPSEGVAVAMPDAYRINLVQSGRIQKISRPVQPKAIGDSDRRWLKAKSACSGVQTIGPTGHNRGEPAMVPRQSPPDIERFPEKMPVLTRLAWNPVGRLWIARPLESLAKPDIVDVFTAEGMFVGSIQGVGVPDAWGWDGQTAVFVEVGLDCRTTIRVRRIRLSESR